MCYNVFKSVIFFATSMMILPRCPKNCGITVVLHSIKQKFFTSDCYIALLNLLFHPHFSAYLLVRFEIQKRCLANVKTSAKNNCKTNVYNLIMKILNGEGSKKTHIINYTYRVIKIIAFGNAYIYKLQCTFKVIEIELPFTIYWSLT